MEKPFLTATLFCISSALTAFAPSFAGDSTQDEVAEPPRDYILSINGDSFVVRPGVELKIERDFKQPTLRLDVGALRHFAYGDLLFDYPAAFVWEADAFDSAMKTWTMDGADISMMIFRTSFEFSADEFADSLEGEFDEIEREEIERSLGSYALSGTQVTTEIAGSTLIYEVLEAPVELGSALIVVMDSTDDGRHTSEYKQAMDLLQQTFRIAGGVDNEQIAELEAKIAAVREQIEVFKVTYTDDQPMMKELYAELAQLEAALEAARKF
jgi:hypothetical protein